MAEVWLFFSVGSALFAKLAIPNKEGRARSSPSRTRRELLEDAARCPTVLGPPRGMPGRPRARPRALMEDVFTESVHIFCADVIFGPLSINLVPTIALGEDERLLQVPAGPCALAVPISDAIEPPARSSPYWAHRQLAS